MSTPPVSSGYVPPPRYSATPAKYPKLSRRSPSTAIGLLVIGLSAFGCLLAASAVRLVLGRFERVTVEGASMEPALQAGDRLLVRKTTSVRPNDIVAAYSPRPPGTLILKRAAVVGPEEAVLLGDNAGHSTDSRHFGPVPLGKVVGRAVYRYAPANRAGPLPSAAGREETSGL